MDNLDDFRDALAAHPDIIMLDNMNADNMKKACAMVRELPRRPLIEASGNVTLANVRETALCGVDIISVGAITHSARALDISLDFDE